jgi:hypothetical protein
MFFVNESWQLFCNLVSGQLFTISSRTIIKEFCRKVQYFPLLSGAQTRIFHELLSRDHEDGRATWQPQGVGSEAYLNGTSQESTPEDARKDAHIRGRSK